MTPVNLKYLLLLLLILGIAPTLNGQGAPCIFDQILRTQDRDSLWKIRHQSIENVIYQKTLSNQWTESRAQYTIPVVVHVVSPPGTPIGQGNNITEQQVEEGLESLNLFLSNSGQFRSPDGFDTDIEVCLAKRDPQGMPTNGITRYFSDLVNEANCNPGFSSANDAELKRGRSWNCREYLNIWLVTNIFDQGGGCGVAGYAYFPGAGCNVDGIVMESRYWRNANSISIAAHELGHYLGLYHTFDGGCQNGDCMINGDRVCDTPPDDSPAFAPCNTNSCNTDNPDLVDDNYNVMDYTACGPEKFTLGQIDRMHAVLQSTRSALTQTINCLPVAELDAQLLSVYSTTGVCTDSLCLAIEFRNSGIQNLKQLTVRYRIDMGAWDEVIWSGNMLTGQNETVFLPCQSIGLGTHQIEVELTGPNSGVDDYLINNVLLLTVDIFEPLSINVVSIEASRCRSNGQVILSASGGATPYSYSMSNGRPTQTSPIFPLMTKGVYSVTVTDINGCEESVTFEIPDSCKVSKPRDFVLNRDAEYNGDQCYTIVEDRRSRSGSLWYSELVDLTEKFVTSFEMNLGCRDADGADGIAFVFQPISTNIGILGGGIGYQGINPSFAVEFDTWQNGNFNDPAFDHIGIMGNGSVVHPGLKAPVPIIASGGNVEDCNWRNVFISWDPQTQMVEVLVECDRRIFYVDDIIQNIFGGNPQVYFGFTAATGGATNVHQVCVNYVSATDGIVGDTICKGDAVEIAAPSVFSSYEWTPTTGISDPGIFNPIFSPEVTTTYYVKMGGECEEILDSVTVVVVDLSIDTLLLSPDSCGLLSNQIEVIPSDVFPELEFSLDGINYQSSNQLVGQPGVNTVYMRLGRCVLAEMINIQRIPELGDSLIYLSPETCDELGQFVITGIEGSPDYEYRLNNGAWQSDGLFDQLSAGVYTYEIKDRKGCVITGAIQVLDHSTPLNLTVDSSDLQIDCCDSLTFISVSLASNIYGEFSLDGGPFQTNGIFDRLITGRHFIVGMDDSDCPTDTLWFEVQAFRSNITPIFFESCAGKDTVINNKRYATSGIYFDTIDLGYCCDSILNITIEINQSTLDTFNYRICPGEEVRVGESIYTINGTYLDTFQNVLGKCDSVVMSTIEFLPISKDSVVLEFCQGDSVRVHGRVIKNPGMYMDTFQNIWGCDSVVYSHVIANDLDTTLIRKAGCPGINIEIGGQSFTGTGEYNIHLKNQKGCDSLVVLDLRIYQEYEINQSIKFCEGQSVQYQGETFDQPGIYELRYTTQQGCDSTYVIEVGYESRAYCDSLRRIYIPNVFTPDGDNLNDRFIIFGNEQLENIDLLEIYDRWGELVFSGVNLKPNNINHGWDGTFRGRPVNPGVYVYRTEVTFLGGIKKQVSGDVTVLK